MEISHSDLQQLLNLADIEGLLALGAPNDEYDHEARSIASVLRGINDASLTEDKLAEVVREVWIRAFGPFSVSDIEKRSRAFRQLAREIQAHASLRAG